MFNEAKQPKHKDADNSFYAYKALEAVGIFLKVTNDFECLPLNALEVYLPKVTSHFWKFRKF